ncbi:MAG: adenylosuccinate lyase [Deltaproteobacteria bacterium]|jgi:adenylosuccinate lyase|nr:adenylosuccinate lyase [Deltaproteobacteria bacterium]MBW1905591.1 adenylosuccinate lyase [Deltaproteobacteria bacterium]MBW2160458.1 adenylosuccinate lyase [Deltaproteobacteria bacterium]MBW2375889.1 adenylosuccinate lyase [Deltaproteobacteria bacterium]MBW2588041.1 adenylosuccinate lyase [Deltaproteobacteria bacterium]
MIPRYSPVEFQDLWSQERKYEAWFDVEIAACRAMEGAGLVPEGTADKVSSFRPQLDADAIDEIEKVTRHDVIAFLTHVEGIAGEPARWLHRGMTSSDVLDSSLALLLVEASDKLLVRLDAVLEALRGRIEEHRRTPAIGRSHGIHAEPVTFGLILAGHYAELARGRQRLLVAREEIAVGKIAGAVGTYAHLTPAIEAEALAALGLRPETASTQVVARDRHAAFVATLGILAAAIERFSTNVRHWQRTEVGEAEEHFKKGQKGSSAMPHKRNPVLTENLCGLGRVVRAAVVPGLENVALWHERDISHSSAERMMLPDATATLAFMLDRVRGVIADLVVYPERLRQNLDQTGGLWASEGILLALIGQGLGRQDAYVLVQRNAMKAFEGEGEFRALLQDDAEIRKHLSADEVDRQFDLNHALSHVDTIIDRVLEGA